MTIVELVSVQPGELRFPFEVKKQISCSLRLVNNTGESVAFKVKTTSPKKYCVRPNTGIVPPHGSSEIIVTMQSQREIPAEMQCKDKFLVQTIIVPKGTSAKDVSQETFSKDNAEGLYETKLKVVLTSPPQPPSPVAELPEEEIDATASEQQQNGEWTSYYQAMNDSQELKALSQIKSELTNVTKERDHAVQLCQRLQQELAMKASSLKEKSSQTAVKHQSGFSFLAILLVCLLGIVIGYMLTS